MKYGKEPELEDPCEQPSRRGFYLALGIVALVAVVASGWFYWLTNRNPVEAASEAHTARRVWELENRLQKISTQLAQLPDDTRADERATLLADAVENQNELMRARPVPQPADVRRLHAFQTQRDDARGQVKNERISQLEVQSDPLLRSSRHAEGVALLKEALILQREINGSGATSAVKNISREERLDQMVLRLEAEPLQVAAKETLARAYAASKAGQWTEALQAFQEARRLQERLNREFGRTPFSDLAVIDLIDTEIASLGAAGLQARVLASLRLAREAAAAGRDAEAIENFQLAAAAQKQINTQFAKSRFVANELLQQIDAELQTVQAGVLMGEIRSLDTAAAGHLRKREVVQAQKKIGAALERVDALAASAPKARGMDSEQRLRLSYLKLRQGDLARIQDQVYDLLLPQPSAESTAMLKTEVSQALFSLVMNSNPSRNLGEALPVDSINYSEALEFTRRLGWILGARVRLPTEGEFRRALGKTTEAAPDSAWTVENSSGQTQPTGRKAANAVGFHDLLGNVSEWLAADDQEGNVAPRMGGNFSSSPADIGALVVERAARTERSRTTGFRVVVEIDLRGK